MLARITRDAVKEKISRGERFALVEALPSFMYRQGHLPGAKNIPPDRVAELAPQLLPDKEEEIVVYCASPT